MPKESEIQSALKDIRKLLFTKRINKKVNFAVKEGYLEAAEILRNNRRTYDGIDHLTTVQGRAIAMLAVDFLNGECQKKVLCGVPIR